MQTATHHSAEVREGVTGPAFASGDRETDPAVINAATLASLEKSRGETVPPTESALREKAKQGAPPDFVALHLETRTHVSTAVMCRHLNRREQTGRGWACGETYPPGLKPLRVMGRLAWPVAGIRAALGVS